MVSVSRLKDTYVNTIGHRASEQALQLGSLFPPAEALQVGLVDQVVPEDQVQSTALSEMARWLAVPGEGWVGLPVGRQSPLPSQPEAPRKTRSSQAIHR